ncbi:DNA mismatch repair protein MutS [Crucibulum laeve]|uniref:DNA mismatch repair protein MutS n=1 Tax=Crucibulum laeve TaxID=68775 RepID=A0A5C3M674_9AGAR|nr:DNA mismatch repair protein MutS [Crucibulum laeve]
MSAPLKRKRGRKAPTPVPEDEDNSDSSRFNKKKVRWEAKSGVTTDDSESSESEETLKTCLATWCSHGRVGSAYYDPVKYIIYVLEDTHETPHFDLTKMLLEQANPDIVLTSSNADDEYMDTLRDYMEAAGGVFQIRPHKEFTASKGRDRMLSLSRLSDLPLDESDIPHSSDIDSNVSKNAYEFAQKRRAVTGDPTTKRWNASIRLANFASVASSSFCLASVGALLDHLVRERALIDFDEDGVDSIEVRDIEPLALDQVMHINTDALLSLQIFENESHASVHSDKTKEGLSLFGTLNNTKTTLGRSLLRTWLLRPSLSLPVINARHNAVACFMRAENLVPANAMHSHLKGIKNVPRILSVLRTGRAKVSDWQGLVKFAFHATMLRDSLTELHQASDVEVVKKLIAALDVTTFKEVGSRVNEIIDWEESTNAGRVCVRPHIDEDLDNRKHVYHGIDSVLSKVAEQISQTVPSKFASSLNVVYFPQLGYLICVPMLKEWQSEVGIQTIDGWTFQFSSDAHVYFKSQEMHDMDTHIGDLHSTIVDREIEIVQELLEEILPADEAMGDACDVCAELDCLLSFAEASRTYDYRRPTMVGDNIINIYQGRHPLQEQVVDIFVPNDACIVGGAGIDSPILISDGDGESRPCHSILLCTGANACGKSVYLKQACVALIHFIPAESATLGIVDKIFTRISTRESVSKVQSAFMIDLNQVSLALRNCTSRSLILLDEFGKGTLSTGSRGPQCPKVLVATHFHDVFNPDLLDPEATPIAFRHMQVMFTAGNGIVLEIEDTLSATGSVSTRRVGPGEKITYLYRIAEGLFLDSHAAKCAEIFGIPLRIAERARYVSHLLSTHELGRLLDEEMADEERTDLEDAEGVCRRFLSWDLNAASHDEISASLDMQRLQEDK